MLRSRRSGLPALALLPALAMLVAACGRSSPTPADPRLVVRRGVEATLAAGTFHLGATLDGSLAVGEAGTSVSLSGTTLEADLDVAARSAHATFGVPALLGADGEIISIGSDAYYMTSLTGPGWFHVTAPSAGPISAVTDPTAALGTITDLLDATDVTLITRNATDCDAGPCSHVELDVPADRLTGLVPSVGGLLPTDLFADGLVVDLYFDAASGRLVEVGSELDSASVRALILRVTLSEFAEEVSIQAPPAKDVQEGRGLPF